MKQTSLILSIIALVAVAVIGYFSLIQKGGKKASAKEGTEAVAAKGAIVYFNLDRVLNEYDMANDLRSVVETKAQGISDEVSRRGNKLQSDFNDFQEKIDKGLMTRSVAEVQSAQLKKRQDEFNTYANQKQQEINEEQQVMLNQIGDSIKKFLDKYNEDKQYAMIISVQGDVLPAPVAAADSSLDITNDLLAGLNDSYVKTKGKSAPAAVTPAAGTTDNKKAKKD